VYCTDDCLFKQNHHSFVYFSIAAYSYKELKKYRIIVFIDLISCFINDDGKHRSEYCIERVFQ